MPDSQDRWAEFLSRGAMAAAGDLGSGTTLGLKAGTRIGPYEVVSKLGAGGMGEVYRARDTKLGRDVAIKVLPAAFTADPDRLARFDREARVLASLNHPNVAAIYGIEESRGVPALVLELVEGDTLAERLESGALPIDAALAIARQVAEALAAAHGRGVIHRDLKPGNIKITPGGVVKVLDFGLAKSIAAEAELRTADVTVVPTEHGIVIGTAPYMSPEQARGLVVDTRTDVWAFGCVLYEMLGGQPAFRRATITDTLAAIVERDADWKSLPRRTPPASASCCAAVSRRILTRVSQAS